MAKNGTNKNQNNPVPPPNNGRKSLEEIKRELQSARPVYQDSQVRLDSIEENAPAAPSEPGKFPGFQARATSPSRPVRSKPNEALIPTQHSPLAGRRFAPSSDTSYQVAASPSGDAHQPPEPQSTRLNSPMSNPTQPGLVEGQNRPMTGPPINQPAEPYGNNIPPMAGPQNRVAIEQPSTRPGGPLPETQGPSGWTGGPTSPTNFPGGREPFVPQDRQVNPPFTSPVADFDPTPSGSGEPPFTPQNQASQPDVVLPLKGTPTAPLSTEEVRRRLSEQTMDFRMPTDSAQLIEGPVVPPRPAGQITQPFKIIPPQPLDPPTQSFNYQPAADSGTNSYRPQPVITPARPIQTVRTTSFQWPIRPVWLVGGLAALVLLVIIVLLVALGNSKKDPAVADNPTATAPGLATTVATTSTQAHTTAAPETTTLVTPVANTTAPVTTVNPNTQALTDAKTASDNQDWPTVVKLLEPLDPNSPDFAKVKPSLLKAYEELGNKASRDPSNSEASANEAVSYYQKAQKLAPNNDQLKLLLNRAVRYQVGRYYYSHNQLDQAVAPLRDLYGEMSTLNPPQLYRDSVELLFNTLLNLGEQAAQRGDKASLETARNFYTEASKLDVANKGVTVGRIKGIDAALTPATPTPASAPQNGGGGGSWVRPAPTPTPAPPVPTKPAQASPPTAVVNMPQMPGNGPATPQSCGSPGQPKC